MALQFRKPKTRKDNSAPATEDIAAAVSRGVAAAIEPLSQKLDSLLAGQSGGIQIDDEVLEVLGADSAGDVEGILKEAAEIAADKLEEDGNAVAAAVVDAGLDTGDVVDELTKRRKSSKADGEAPEELSVEEVAEVIAEIAVAVADELPEASVEELVEEGYLDEGVKETPDATSSGAKRRGRKSETRGRKSAVSGYHPTPKANTPPFQRKFGHLYTSAKASQLERPTLTREQKMVKLARAVKCLDIYPSGIGAPVRDIDAAARAAIKMYGDQQLAREIKSMSVSEPSAGGFLVPQDTMADIIELLYNETVVFELGAQKVPMRHGNLTIPKMTSGTRAHFQGEARPVKSSRPSLGQLHLSSKRLDGMVISTEELLMSTDYSSEVMFGNDLMEQMKQGVEYGALLARGTEFEPLGIYRNKNVEKVNLLTINDVQLADEQGRPTADLPMFLSGKVGKKNVRGRSFGWTFNSDMETYLKRMKDDSGNYIWKDEMAKGELDSKPYKVTNLIPTYNNGTTIMIFGLWSDLLVGDQMGLTTRTSYDATVQTDNGSVNLFQNVQTATRAALYMDTGLRHDESFIVATNVKVFG